jgi:chromosome segregation ATPase
LGEKVNAKKIDFFRGSIGIWAILLWFFFSLTFLFAGEIYRWTDEKGVVYFTDDLSKIPPQYQKQLEKREMKEEVYEADKKQTIPGKPSMTLQGKPGRAKQDSDIYERKIESKKAIEGKIAMLEEEMRAAEERIKQLKETEEYQHSVTRYRYDKGGRAVAPIDEPPTERERLQLRIRNIKKEIAALEEQLSQIKRSL